MQKSNHALEVFAYYWQHLRHYPRYVAGLMIALPVTVLVNNYIPPLILAVVLNRLSEHKFVPHQLWAGLGWYLLAYGILAVFGGLLWRIVDHFAWRLEGNIERDLAQEVFEKLTTQGADFHANHFVGSLVSDTSKLLGSYIRLADTTFFQVIPTLLGLIFVCIIMASRSWLYSVLLLSFSIIYIWSSFIVTKPVRKFSAESAAAQSKQTGVLADALTNVLAIKSFAREHFERKRFAKATDVSYNKLLRVVHASQRQMSYFGITTGVLQALALVVAVYAVTGRGSNLATAFLIFNYTTSITSQLFSFANNSLRNYNRSLGDAYAMVETLKIEPEVVDPIEPEPSKLTNGDIRFQDVTFTHNGANDAIFENLNIHIRDGEKIGLVGHSGSGKTTFTRLLLRYSDIDEGTIAIHGQNIAKVTQADLHRAIAYVPQEPLLFHRSIAENISYGKEDASIEEIRYAAKRANAAEFIETLPQGYDTLVGERGVKLSGGQRQRVAIARAMLKNAPILLLDEATSALDSESEGLIQDALWKLMEGRTAIVIAHRLSTIQRMDRILVLDNGVIVEEGTHKELILKNGTYAKLWARQSGGFMED
jgi:ATP-binding cassette subfamily B protein